MNQLVESLFKIGADFSNFLHFEPHNSQKVENNFYGPVTFIQDRSKK